MSEPTEHFHVVIDVRLRRPNTDPLPGPDPHHPYPLLSSHVDESVLRVQIESDSLYTIGTLTERIGVEIGSLAEVREADQRLARERS